MVNHSGLTRSPGPKGSLPCGLGSLKLGVSPPLSGLNCKVSTETAHFSELLKLLLSEQGFMRDLAIGVGFV